MVQFIIRATLTACLLAVAAIATPGSAQTPRQNEAGQFDFYVLSLSWSPSVCAAAAERAAARLCRGMLGDSAADLAVFGEGLRQLAELAQRK